MIFYRLLIFLLIALLPFFPKQYFNNHFKYEYIIYFSVLLLPIFIPALFTDIKRRFIPTFCFLVFLIPLAISTIYSIDKDQSILQLRLFLSFFVIFVTSRVIFPNLRSKELLFTWYLLIVSILSFIALYNTLIRRYFNEENVSFLWVYFGHNHLSALLIFAIPFCLYFLSIYWKNKKIRILTLAICIFLLISLLFTFSISAMIMLAFSIFIVWILFKKSFPLGKSFIIVFFIAITFSLLSLFAFTINKGIKDLDFEKNPIVNLSGRFVHWQIAYDNFIQKPFIGSGPHTFGLINKSMHFSVYTHNFFIQMLTDSGIFGFLTSAGLIAAIFWYGYKTIKSTFVKRERLLYFFLFTALLSSTLLASIDIDWHLPTVFLFFWIFAGILRKNVN